MKLIDYINKHYSSVTSFAEANDMKRQQAAECVNKGYYHAIEIDGVLMLVIAKRELVETDIKEAKKYLPPSRKKG